MAWLRRKPDWSQLALTYESAMKIADRKNIWMVNYLRGRRTGDDLLPYYRERYFAQKAFNKWQGWLANYEDGEDGPHTYEWDEGTAP